MDGITETVAVLTRSQTGTDGMGEPTYDWASQEVPGVLVRPVSGAELNDALRPDGIRVSYVLSFPKSCDLSLAHARVALVERGMSGDPENVEKALVVTGIPDRTWQSPLEWDRDVEVGRTDG